MASENVGPAELPDGVKQFDVLVSVKVTDQDALTAEQDRAAVNESGVLDAELLGEPIARQLSSSVSRPQHIGFEVVHAHAVARPAPPAAGDLPSNADEARDWVVKILESRWMDAVSHEHQVTDPAAKAGHQRLADAYDVAITLLRDSPAP